MTEEQVAEILTFANTKLSNHPEYEPCMRFNGADISPIGQIIPRFVTGDDYSGMSGPKVPVYQEVWKGTVLELRL